VRTPLRPRKCSRTANTGPRGEDASSFVDIADEQIRDHADEELNSPRALIPSTPRPRGRRHGARRLRPR
jgi:hypothetical protein